MSESIETWYGGKFRSWAPRTALRRQSHVAHLGTAHEEEINDETSTAPDDDPCDPEDACYMCLSCGPDQDFNDVEDRIEQDVLTCFLAAGANLEEK